MCPQLPHGWARLLGKPPGCSERRDSRGPRVPARAKPSPPARRLSSSARRQRAAPGLLRVATGSCASASGRGRILRDPALFHVGVGRPEPACCRPLQLSRSSAPCCRHPGEDTLNSALAKKSHWLSFVLRPLKMTGPASQNNDLSGAGKQEAEPSSVVRGPP